MLNFAILAVGGIAETMARTLNGMDGVCRYAVASRSLCKAQDFAKRWDFESAYGSYEEMLSDPKVDLVYVCTPHSCHYRYAKLCLEYGKHVLVEKAFTVNAEQARELVRISEEKHLLVAEAIWTRYMPSRKMIDEIIASGMIGNVRSVTANLGYPISHVERLIKPELAGGALLDLGVYTINFALMAKSAGKSGDGECEAVNVEKIESSAVKTCENGVDLMHSITLTFDDDSMAVLHSTILSQTDRLGAIYGDKGYIEVQNINNCEEIRVYGSDNAQLLVKRPPKQITGFEYEVEACMRAIAEGKTECSEMPHGEIIHVMEIMDEIRNQWGVRFPCEGI